MVFCREFMKKGIWLSLGALILIGVIVFAVWYINEEEKMRSGNKDSFIPYNSALVVSINAKPDFSPEMVQALGEEINRYRRKLLVRVVDSLCNHEYVMSYPYVTAARVEGKNDVAFLYVMDNKNVLSRNEIVRFLNQTFGTGTEKVRKYDHYKIYSLKQQQETVYFAVCGGIILISDSELYIEDGLKQFDLESTEGLTKPRYQNLNKYFSAGAGVNIFLNTTAFTDLMPLYVQTKKVFPHLDITRLFKWGALDGEFSTEGVYLNGFLHYGEQKESYIRTLKEQQPRGIHIDGVVPTRLNALGILNLSHPSAYFSALESYRYSMGLKNRVYERKQQYIKMFGRKCEGEMQNLLQGEFAAVELGYNGASQEKDGLVIASLKSGSLGRILLEKMMQAYANFDGGTMDNYLRQYRIDREKIFSYYRFPVEDMPAVYWGYIFEGIKSRYVLVEDNYLIFASSENAMKNFIRDYVHGSFIRDAEWYKNLKNKLAGKHNLSYFARTAEVLPQYRDLVSEKARRFISERMEKPPVFPTWALQWSNEGNMLYNTLFLNPASVQDEIQPHVLWQTRLDGQVSMKPVPVVNHVTGERELFVQDEQNTIYLINDAGRVLWKVPADGRINSEVYQVDLFKNGKLQYLFSTPTRMYLIDRNGNAAGRFPLTFRSRCEQGISVCDYDNNKNYRIFAPCADREIYLYGLDGNLVKGWKPEKADKPIVSKVQHFRVDGKDYLVFADHYRLYILDRKGNERVRVSSVFDLPVQTNIYLVKKKGRHCLVFAGNNGAVHSVDFQGRTETFKVEGMGNDFKMNVADVDNDGAEDCIFTDKNRLLIVRTDGKIISENEVEAVSLDYPYIYRFSATDSRIGVTDSSQSKMLLLTPDGKLSKGFPIAGDSPFSIVFSGNDGFFLFAGTDNGSLIKYKVQR